MGKKCLFSTLLAVVLLITGCSNNDTTSPENNSSDNINNSAVSSTNSADNSSDSSEEDISEQEKATALKQASDLAKSEDYKKAAEIIKSALDKYGDDEHLKSTYEGYYKQYIEQTKSRSILSADELMNDGKFLDALKVLKTALSITGEDEDINQRLEDCETTYVADLTTQIKEKVNLESFDSAIELLDEGKYAFPENKEILALYDFVENSKPVYIIDMTVTDGSFSTTESAKDTVGNEYYNKTKNIFVSHSFYDKSITYYLGGKYSKFVFDFAVSSETGKKTSKLNIIGNENNMLYTSGFVDRKFIPSHIELDVSGLDWLQIRSYTNGESTGSTGSDGVILLVINPRLYK